MTETGAAPARDGAPGTFSYQLESWLLGDGPKTIGDLGEVFAEKSFAVTVLFLMFLPALPLPTGGISHVFEAITILVAAQMVVGRRTLWLPQRAKRRELGAATLEKAIPFMVRRIRWFERFSKPRMAHLFDNRLFRCLLGAVIMGLSLSAMLSPPFSGLDTLPSMGAVVVALSIILEDVLVLGIGVAIGTGGVAVTLTVGAAVFQGLKRLF